VPTVTEPTTGPTPLRNKDLQWLDDCLCAQLADTLGHREALSLFFVDAGRTMPAEALRIAKYECPVRREEIIHAYTGGPGGGPIKAGYFGGFSYGERKAMTLQQALAKAEAEQAAYRAAHQPT